ncbi:2-polyprenyl-6-methoxyphenol hydroxylase [Nakamurella flava]|uniref:2-polyprenyl-6-methoxyphenol hydroxylase n=1 Tax=Nakamurella flava TaxID=2576308 RepID=A0A4U6QMV5_9ACTN|nr:FAD-dependent monooxygenase [Nakamurella flava]TKV61771.1 2-polyprenyl-6-methoxyphenol hydroxylase [Nakamurella flava]
MSLRVACIGAGPGGLFAATLIRRLLPDSQVTVYERNRAEDVFGFGVVFSDQTLERIDAADPVLRDALARHGKHWDSIDVRLKGEQVTFAGNGMAAIHRRTLLSLLQDRAAEFGVDVRWSSAVPDIRSLAADHDLIVAADGANSASRESFADALGPQVQTATAKFIWFGTTHRFDGLTFLHRSNKHGHFAVHAYPVSDDVSTFIVEADEPTWRAAGLDSFDVTQPPGPSDLKSKAYLQALFAPDIDGEPLLDNNSRWGNFRTRRTASWHATAGGTPVVWLGDAVHTAHFSVGSGTKMAMEDAVSLAQQLAARPTDLPAALAAYEADRQPEVARIQDSARPSLSWWENFGRYHDAFAPWQFGFHFFSRSITADKLRRRDPAFVAQAEQAWQTIHGAAPLDTPLAAGDLALPGRLVRLSADGRTITTTDPAGGPDRHVSLRAAGEPTVPGSALRVEAPKEEAEVDSAAAAALQELDRTGQRALVVVTGGTRLTRALLSERLRFTGSAVTVVVDDPPKGVEAGTDPTVAEHRVKDQALTLVLSGRADGVAATVGGDR